MACGGPELSWAGLLELARAMGKREGVPHYAVFAMNMTDRPVVRARRRCWATLHALGYSVRAIADGWGCDETTVHEGLAQPAHTLSDAYHRPARSA